MPSTTKVQRWLDLVAFLAGRRMPVAVEEIMERVPSYAVDWTRSDETRRASVRRKFERDKDELRALGIPIRTVDYSINYGMERVKGYQLRSRDFYLPYLRLVSEMGQGGTAEPTSVPESGAPSASTFELRESQARAAVEALRRVSELSSFPFRREARSALRKLTFDLDPTGRSEGAVATPLRYLDPPGADDLKGRLRVLSGALLRRKEVRFGYYGIHRDSESERRVQPFGLLFQHSHWYLIGYDLDREDVRVFRVGRMNDVGANTRRAKTPDYEIPDDFDLDRWAGRPPWALPGQDDEPLEVTVHFDFPRSLWAERNRHGEPVETLEGGGQLRRFQVQDTAPFLRWLLTLREEARIEAPPGLEEERRALFRRVAELHGAPKRGGRDSGVPDSREDADG